MLTLGHQVAEWIVHYLPLPDDPSRPFELVTSQVEFLLRFYEVDEHGRFLNRRAAFQQAKGRGKSPLGSVIGLAEFRGPVLFDGFDADGKPVGRPWGTGGAPPPYCQIAALSVDQASSNVYSLAWAALAANGGAAAEALGIDVGRTRLYVPDMPGAKLEAVTADEGSRSGQRLTFALLDEVHLWTKSNRGDKLANTLRANLGKMGGRSLECSNAFELGSNSVAEATFRAHQDGEPGILFVADRPSIAIHPDMTDDDRRAALAEVYSDSTWVDLERLVAESHDPAMPWNEFVRLFLNVPATGAEAFCDPLRWAELASQAKPKARGAAGFAGTSTEAALIFVDEAGLIVVLGLWSPPPDAKGMYRVPRGEVHRAVEELFDMFEVGRFYVSPGQWRTELEEWAEQYGGDDKKNPVVLKVPYDSARRFGPAVDRFRVAVDEGKLSHDGDREMAEHVANARLLGARGGHLIEPADPGRPVSACRAAILAYEASYDIPHEEEMQPPVFIDLDRPICAVPDCLQNAAVGGTHCRLHQPGGGPPPPAPSVTAWGERGWSPVVG